MSAKCAKDMPAGFSNRIERVALVGATGQLGKHFVEELLKTGKHTVTTIGRPGSTSVAPKGVKAVSVDYNDEQALVNALKGQQFLLITLSVLAPPDTQSKLIKAAAKAGVPHIMPNIYGLDHYNEKLVTDSPLGGIEWKGIVAEIEAAGLAWTSMICNLWYEYSLCMGPIWFGFDFAQKKLTLYDDGNTKVNVTTWQQCGRAVAALLSLKVLPEDASDKSATVSDWRGKPLAVSSFLISQRDMFESWKRVSGDKDSDWTIENEPSKERYEQGIQAMKSASDPLSARMGAAKASFVRVFFPNGGGDYESSRGIDNAKLGLPQEDLDERTGVSKQMLERDYAAEVFGRLSQTS